MGDFPKSGHICVVHELNSIHSVMMVAWLHSHMFQAYITAFTLSMIQILSVDNFSEKSIKLFISHLIMPITVLGNCFSQNHDVITSS